jgi:hypothetical protein
MEMGSLELLPRVPGPEFGSEIFPNLLQFSFTFLSCDRYYGATVHSSEPKADNRIRSEFYNNLLNNFGNNFKFL